MAAGRGPRLVHPLHQRPQQDVVYQGGLARPRDAGDGHEAAERQLDVDVFEVVLPGALDGHPVVARRAPHLGDRDGAATGQVVAGHRLLAGQQPGNASRVDHLAAVLPRPRADVDYVVGHPDGVLVVLDDHDGVAQVAQAHQGFDQLVVVALVQPDGRLVQHVEDPDQRRADLGCQAYPLGLAAGEGPGRAVEIEVAQADVEEEPHAGVDLLDDPLGDEPVAIGQLQAP